MVQVNHISGLIGLEHATSKRSGGWVVGINQRDSVLEEQSLCLLASFPLCRKTYTGQRCTNLT